jgi:hypothetical protein
VVRANRRPRLAAPGKPAVLVLVEDEERLVAQLGEFSPPTGAAANRQIVLNRADDVDLLAAVHLVPQRLQDPAERRPLGVPPVHQPRDVRQADVPGQQLFVVEHPDAAMAVDPMAVEGEVHLFDAVALGAVAEARLGARRTATEQDAVGRLHRLG